MFARNSKVALTFLCLVVALGLATVSEANSLVHPSRDHAQVSRMIKKRSPFDDPFTNLIPVVGAAGNPTASVSTDTTATTSTTGTTTGTESATTTDSTSTDTSSSTTSSDTSSSTTSSTTSSSSSTTSSSSSTTSSSTTSSTSSTTSSSSSTTSSDTSIATPPPASDTLPASTHTEVKVVTADDPAASPSSTSGASTSGASSNNNSKITRTTLTVIIVIAASIGFIALAWTLFRKWKLRPSSNFDDRMQPIDWQPTGPEDTGLPSHRRANSTASHGSFQSSGHGHSGLEPLPEHDFTAGPTTLAPVGGYADLQRGPSPQPMAQLHRGPSATRADYAAYDYNNGPRY